MICEKSSPNGISFELEEKLLLPNMPSTSFNQSYPKMCDFTTIINKQHEMIIHSRKELQSKETILKHPKKIEHRIYTKPEMVADAITGHRKAFTSPSENVPRALSVDPATGFKSPVAMLCFSSPLEKRYSVSQSNGVSWKTFNKRRNQQRGEICSQWGKIKENKSDQIDI